MSAQTRTGPGAMPDSLFSRQTDHVDTTAMSPIPAGTGGPIFPAPTMRSDLLAAAISNGVDISGVGPTYFDDDETDARPTTTARAS